MWIEFFAGLGFFLFGMHRLEAALKELAGRRFKQLLRRTTKNWFLGILNGVFATAVLQSSTLVILIVLAFVGAGILQLSHALGIILGANLGTTFTGWLVAMLGFKLDLKTAVLPLIATGCCGIVLLGPRFRFYHWMSMIASLGFLLMGLVYMRQSLESQATTANVQFLQGQPLAAYFAFGFVLTSIINSSSAMMTLTLSALSAGLVDLTSGAGIVIGADLGTTMTAVFSSFAGAPVKKRVAAAHFLFNLCTGTIAIIGLRPLLYFVREALGVSDPLVALVAFHSSFNFIGILIFSPFIKNFEALLNRMFVRDTNGSCQYITRVGLDLPEASLAAVHRELEAVTLRIFDFNLHILGHIQGAGEFKRQPSAPDSRNPFVSFFMKGDDALKAYESLKGVESEILSYISGVQRQKLETNESSILQRQILALRYAIQSAKAIKDIEHNLKEFSSSGGPLCEEYQRVLLKNYESLFSEMNELWIYHKAAVITEHLNMVTQMNESAFAHTNQWIYENAQSDSEGESRLSTFLNVNKELHSSCRYLILALRELHQP